MLLICHRHFDDVKQTLRHLSAQTIAAHLELVLIVQPASKPTLEPGRWATIGHVQILELPSIGLFAEAWAQGIHQATAPYFVLGEDHSFPAPQWAEALVDALSQGFTAVCPAIESANRSLTALANYLNCFGSFFQPTGLEPRQTLAGHNSAYRRDVMRRRFPNLATALRSEASTHLVLAAEGHQLRVVGTASTAHVNLSRWPNYCSQSFLGGQIFGAHRAVRWTLGRKLTATAALPLVPFVRTWRIRRLLSSPEKRGLMRWPAVIPAMFAGLLLHAWGEVWGYWRGEQNAAERYSFFEADRKSCVRPEDWALWQVDPQPDTVGASR